jgi:signal transduction histidine kinase/CheY-like chemotaxis protein/HPt (histidine-containing phosphotransfer) domain-containing protein/HAMP domain-containing protein
VLTFFKRLSIIHQLTALMVSVSAVGLLIASFSYFIAWRAQTLESIERNLKSTAAILADTGAQLLAEKNSLGARIALKSLVDKGSVAGVTLFYPDGRILAQAGLLAPKKLSLSQVEFNASHPNVRLTEPCKINQDGVGYVTVVMPLAAFHQQQRDFIRLGLGVSACCVFLCILASFHFQRWLTRPVLELAKLAKTISKDNNYGLRAKKEREDEIGSLYDSFNHMLEQVEERTDKLRRKTALLQLMESISRAANQAKNPDQAMKLGMDSLCAYTGWPLAHAWKVYPEGSGQLISSHLWCVGEEMSSPFLQQTLPLPRQNLKQILDSDLDRFQDLTTKMSLRAGEELAGTVLASRQPLFIADLAAETRFNRGTDAAALGLKAALAFPLVVNDEVVAVLELFSIEKSEIDDGLLVTLSQIGTHLGRVFERFRIGRELIVAKDAAEMANRSKSSFLATMSHEIRTPLNTVLGMTGLLLETELNADQRDYARTVRSSGEGLLHIINDILDFSKIEAGHLELEKIPFDLLECIEGALELVAALASNKGLELAYSVDEDVPGGLVGDTTRLRQVLINLLSNAIKFTSEGDIVLSVRKEGEKVHFAVRDSGIGIPEDRIGNLFTPFTQVDSSVTRRFGGTGLGLAICKSFVEAMGGQIRVTSEIGKGSTFHFYVIAEEATPTARPYDEIPEIFKGKRVLLVDDNETNRKLLRTRAAQWGFVVTDFERPAQALTCVSSGTTFDLAVLDIQMPEMDGLELARQLRNHTQMPLIAWTSLGRREAGSQEYFAAYLQKPLRPSLLHEVLNRILLGTTGKQAESQFDAALGETHPLRILVADDLHVNIKMMLIILQKMGYQAEAAANGLEVLEAMQRSEFDVILMDVQMPEMDGIEATRRIVAEYAQRPRIIALTANVTSEDREVCRSAGMDDFLAKPIQSGALREALMRCKRHEHEEVAQQAPATAKKGSQEKPSGWQALPTVDPQALGNLKDVYEFGGPEAVKDLIETLEAEFATLSVQAKSAFESGNLTELALVTHTIKGSSANFGAVRLSALATLVEKSAKEGSTAGVEEALAHLGEECRVAVQAFREEFPCPIS